MLVSVLVLGAVLATAAGAVAVFAFFHGHVHGAEMPATASGVLYGVGFVTTTALLHAGAVGVALTVRHSPAKSVWLRASGASIMAAGALLAVL